MNTVEGSYSFLDSYHQSCMYHNQIRIRFLRKPRIMFHGKFAVN